MPDLTVTITESLTLNGYDQGSSNAKTISGISESLKRIVAVTTTEAVIASFGASMAAGTYIKGDVRYIRITNKDTTNFVYLVFKNEYNNEFCVKLDKGLSFIYNADQASGVIDTMLANQVALGFTEATGDTADGSDDITNITANGAIIPGLRVTHDNAQVASGGSVGAVTGAANGVSAATAHTLVTRHATTGAESVANIASHTSGSSDTNGTSTYAAGFGDLSTITAEGGAGTVDLEVFIAST